MEKTWSSESQKCHKARRHRSVFYLGLSDSGADTRKKTQGPGHVSGLTGHLPHTETHLLSRSFRIFQYPSRQKVQLSALGTGSCYYSIFGDPLKESCCKPAKGWSLSLSGEVSLSDPLRVNPGEMASYLAKRPPFRKASHLKSR